MAHAARIGGASLLMLAASACGIPQKYPGAARVAPWQRQYAALGCWSPGYDYDMPSARPLSLAMISVCKRRTEQRAPQHGYQTLVTIDAATGVVRGIPITANYSGGVHFAADGSVVWYSSGNKGEAAKTQRYVEAFALRPGEAGEISLGRIAVPYITGPGLWRLAGEGCSLLLVQAYRHDDKDPDLRSHFIVRDGAPFDTSPLVPGIGSPLFWDPRGKNFVVQEEPPPLRGPRRSTTLHRFAVDCDGRRVALDPVTAERLRGIERVDAWFQASSRGDLVVVEHGDVMAPDILQLFTAGRVQRIESPEMLDTDCPDLSCAPLYLPLGPVRWSRSGELFMFDYGLSDERVYRAADLQLVSGWKNQQWGGLQAIAFIDDHAALEFIDGGRIRFHEWASPP